MSEFEESINLLTCIPKITIKQKISYSCGHILNDICAALWFSYTLLFFQVVLSMPPIMAGAMLLIGQVADAVATPIVGIYTDRAGSRKIWHLIGTVAVIFSFPLIFSPCPGCQDLTPSQIPKTTALTQAWTDLSINETWLRGMYYSALIVVFQAGWASVQISHLALIPDLTPKQTERAELTAIRYTASVCASVFIYLVTWIILHYTAKEENSTIGPDDAYKFRDIVLIGLLVGSVFSVCFQCFLKPTPTHSINYNTQVPETTGDLKTQLRKPQLLPVSILYVSSRLFVTLSLVYMPLYLVETLGEKAETLATIPLVSYIASFLSGLSIRHLSSCVSSKFLYLVGAISCIVGCAWIEIGFGTLNEKAELYMVAVLLGIGSSVTTISSLCLTADLIGSNNGNGAFLYSIVTFADKLLNGVVVILIESLKCEDYWTCPHYYRNVLAYTCGGSAILGIGSLTMIWGKSKIGNS